MSLTRLLCLSSLMALGAFAASPDLKITYNLSGTLTPNENSGPDCLGLNTKMASASATISPTTAPFKTTTNSASYHIPAGGVSVTAPAGTFTNKKPWVMKVTLGRLGDTLTFSGALASPLGTVDAKSVSGLARNSFKLGILKHPVHFSPSPQALTAANSSLTYAVPAAKCTATKLGFTGTITN